jgi:2-haloacid dehalogenase
MPSRRTFVKAALAGVTISALASSSERAQGRQPPQRRPRVLAFDVNETMLDINALGAHFTRAFGSADALREWFSNLLLYSNVLTLAGPYAEFGAIGGAVLDMIASARGVTLTSEDRNSVLGGMRTLPAHPDVPPALTRLRQADFRMVTLTNSAPAAVEAQLKSAGIGDFFERSFSVDAVKRFKPAPEPYRYVARELGVPPNELRMIAAHGWDVLGALQAGCTAAFVARSGKVLFPLGPKPDIVAPDLTAVADRILEVDRDR